MKRDSDHHLNQFISFKDFFEKVDVISFACLMQNLQIRMIL